jgi:hypothetical protein
MGGFSVTKKKKKKMNKNKGGSQEDHKKQERFQTPPPIRAIDNDFIYRLAPKKIRTRKRFDLMELD